MPWRHAWLLIAGPTATITPGAKSAELVQATVRYLAACSVVGSTWADCSTGWHSVLSGPARYPDHTRLVRPELAAAKTVNTCYKIVLTLKGGQILTANFKSK